MDKDTKRYKEAQEELLSGSSVPFYSNDTINYIDTSIGKALYKNALGRPRKSIEEKANPYDRIICDVCNVKFTRSHRSGHNKTKVHQAYAKMNEKMKRFLLGKEDN